MRCGHVNSCNKVGVHYHTVEEEVWSSQPGVRDVPEVLIRGGGTLDIAALPLLRYKKSTLLRLSVDVQFLMALYQFPKYQSFDS